MGNEYNQSTPGLKDDDFQHWLERTPFEIPVTIIEMIMAVIILLGNGLVIAAYISDRKLRTVTNFFLVNLVIADCIVGLTLPISCGIYFIPEPQRNRWLCILQFSIIAVPLGASTLCLLLITVERYLSVVYPFHHQQMFTKARRYALVAVSWALAFLIMGIVPFALPETVHIIVFKMDCDMMRVIPSQYWSYVVLPFAYVLFGSVIIVYMKILKVARRQIKSIELLVLQVSITDKKSIRNVRLARTGFILLGLFIICWLPFTIILTITAIGDFQDNQILTILRIAAMVLTPASSAINPVIYAARIRRFKLRMKKLLNLTISNSDKYVTYEIRQSFKVKRAVSPPPYKKVIEPVISFDSGVGASNDDDCEEIEKEPSDIYDHFRHRALSRISESPENLSHLGSSPRIHGRPDYDKRQVNINHADDMLNGRQPPPSAESRTCRTVKPPQFLDVPSHKHNESHYTRRTSYTEEHSSCGTLYDNVASPHLRNTTNRAMTPSGHRHSTSAICAEPIIVECNDKSEYFRLVVRRTMRECSDSESEPEAEEAPGNLNTLGKKIKANKNAKNKPKMVNSDSEDSFPPTVNEQEVNDRAGTPDIFPKHLLTPNCTPDSPMTATLERTPRINLKNIHHQRSSSGLSTGSVGMTLDNDDIQFEITNANRGSKRMNRFMQISQASLQRRQKKTSRPDGDEEYRSDVDRKDKTTSGSGSFVKDIWDGTLRRLRRSGRSKALLRGQKASSILSANSAGFRLSRQLSHSLSDVSQHSPTPAVQVIHQRSRSALAENEVYVTLQTGQTEGTLIASPQIQHKSQRSSIELHIDSKKLSTENTRVSVGHAASNTHTKLAVPNIQHRFRTSRHSRTRLASWSHSEVDSKGLTEIHNPNKRHANNNYAVPDTQCKHNSSDKDDYRPNPVSVTTSVDSVCSTTGAAPHSIKDFFHEILVNQEEKPLPMHGNHATMSDTTQFDGHMGNDVMLPVILRLPGGKEQDILLTKRDIYGSHQKAKRRYRPLEVTVRRKRSMSQPNLHVRQFAR